MSLGILRRIILLLVCGLLLPNQLYGSQDIIQKEIIYCSPKSGEVFLVWGVDGWTHPDSMSSNNVKVIKGLLYTPMAKNSDTFRTKVFVPFGSTLDFVFQTSRNNNGQLTDVWDNNGAEGIDYHSIVTDSEPIRIKANLYSSEKRTKLIEIGWILLGISVIIPGIFLLLWHLKKISNLQVSLPHRLIAIAFSLFIFHSLARFEILAQLPMTWFQFKSYYKLVLAASVYDLAYVTLISVVFLAPILIIKRSGIQRIFYVSFCFASTVSIAMAILNITAVHYLGRPFNYQWIYYSGFLGSTEAKNAILETGLTSLLLNTIALCAAMFFLATSIIEILYRLPKTFKIQYSMAIVLLPLPLLVIFQSLIRDVNLEQGKTHNAVYSFVSSFVSSQVTPSFFDMKIPDKYKYSQSTQAKYNHSNTGQNPIAQNILLIVLESAGAEYFDLFGGRYNITPHLNKYQSSALFFDNMYANSPASNKSMVSILCSQYPWVSYRSLTQEYPNFKRPSLSSELKKVGYRTSYFTSADSRFQNGHKFLSFREFDVHEDFSKIKCQQQYQFNNKSYKNGNGIDDYCLVKRFENWLDEGDKKPFFSMIWTNQGHYPYFVSGEEMDFGVESPDLNRYLNAIHHYDEVFGALMKALDVRKLTASTLVIIVGDHGEAFGRHGQFGHATKLYEENIKIPLMFIHSSFNGKRDSSIAELKDIASTVLPLVGLQNPEIWQGRNLIRSENDEAFFFAPWSDYLFGYRKGQTKYIFDETNEKVEVYFLDSDSTESQNLAKKINPDEIEQARYKLASWVQYQDIFVKKIFLAKQEQSKPNSSQGFNSKGPR